VALLEKAWAKINNDEREVIKSITWIICANVPDFK
jgi:hypothetical protein